MANRNISKSYQIHTWSNCTDTPFNSFSYRFIKFSFSPDSTRLADPSRSPVYSDIFNYLLNTFCLVLLTFRFQKCRDPKPRLDSVGESKPEPGLLRHFQLSSQRILFGFIKFSFSKVSRPESPTRPGWRIQAGARFTPIFSIIFSKHVVCVILF